MCLGLRTFLQTELHQVETDYPELAGSAVSWAHTKLIHQSKKKKGGGGRGEKRDGAQNGGIMGAFPS